MRDWTKGLFFVAEKKGAYMSGFRTNNSVYTLDITKRTISGGALGQQIVPFIRATVLIGLPAEIELADGRFVRTSTVKSYI